MGGMMNIIEMIAEDRIQQAISDGHFSNLQGQGKPLQKIFDDQIHAETRLTHHILRNNGFLLPWIDLQKEILAEITAARSFLMRSYQVGDVSQLNQIILERFGEKVVKINRLILVYNLKVPLTGLQYLPLCVEKEISDYQKTLSSDLLNLERIL
jgi:hypothetical protein